MTRGGNDERMPCRLRELRRWLRELRRWLRESKEGTAVEFEAGQLLE